MDFHEISATDRSYRSWGYLQWILLQIPMRIHNYLWPMDSARRALPHCLLAVTSWRRRLSA